MCNELSMKFCRFNNILFFFFVCKYLGNVSQTLNFLSGSENGTIENFLQISRIIEKFDEKLRCLYLSLKMDILIDCNDKILKIFFFFLNLSKLSGKINNRVPIFNLIETVKLPIHSKDHNVFRL